MAMELSRIRTYLVVWGADYQYPGKQKVEAEYFNENNGYDLHERREILALEVGEIWQSAIYSDHSVLRER